MKINVVFVRNLKFSDSQVSSILGEFLLCAMSSITFERTVSLYLTVSKHLSHFPKYRNINAFFHFYYWGWPFFIKKGEFLDYPFSAVKKVQMYISLNFVRLALVLLQRVTTPYAVWDKKCWHCQMRANISHNPSNITVIKSYL